mmetsp:Transcript_69953/g.145835  ORF Transcript_69953/g.145835 Transcript_69953/m.145835 type:complete len:190 (+) Transcript_69953:396-965(+)|eukprot:CAMPEP_0181316796 /NCGR_PEP_ID=MMETSP1101-20121128/16087_1 /TAXON_ID=46948 /ORGANISM="Rhodomonas abbreviata, Strain Caron Lab Isolate" /LENGTH=189 /DNA_ID=CAMNT_0023424069 /DNA_START=396 /DNA_END=965 /DNA_ORIENTATION=-
MAEVKILMVGPKEAGKSALANYIADAVQNSENPSLAPTKPTVGVRILEFDRQTKKGNQAVNVSVELWDVSGDRAYEGGWPAIMHNAMGVVFVYNAEKAGEEKDLEQWHKWFAVPQGLKESQCLILAHRKTDGKVAKQTSAKALAKIHSVSTTLEDNQPFIKEEFDKFLVHVTAAAAEMRDREEQNVLGQ